jgi:two-component system chemotaxis response regulator CheB
VPPRVIRVLIIDDSPLVQRIISEGLSKDPNIEVCGVASDPFAGRDAIVKLRPDVLTLDVEMPKMNGVEFLRRLMPQYPIPVVMVSSLTERGQKTTLEAMAAGAVDFGAKPQGGDLNSMIDELRTKVKIAATVNVSHWKNRKFEPATCAATGQAQKVAGQIPAKKICAIGASTGGTEALREVICAFPKNFIGTVIVQHMPAGFTKMFADRLNGLAQVVVKEAVDGDIIYDGRVLIAPGGKQMEVVRTATGGWGVRCFDAPLCCGHRPSVEEMMLSIAKNVGGKAIGAMLTGMGSDGANGMKAMRDAGARCIAQDEATSVVFGMPKEAYAKGGAESLVPLPKIAATLINMAR